MPPLSEGSLQENPTGENLTESRSASSRAGRLFGESGKSTLTAQRQDDSTPTPSKGAMSVATSDSDPDEKDERVLRRRQQQCCPIF